MSKFVPLSEQSSKELKRMIRAVEGSIKKSLPVPLDAGVVWYYIYDELVALSAHMKEELAIRWGFCQGEL